MATPDSRFSQRHLIGLLLVLVVSVGLIPLFYRSWKAPASTKTPTVLLAVASAPSPVVAATPIAKPSSLCDRPDLTEAQVATYRNISPAALEEFKNEHNLSNAAICKMSEEILREEISWAGTPEADGPAEAQALRLLQQQDENGFIPTNGLQKAADQMALMRAAQGQQPPPQADIASSQWEWLGPGNIGGRIRSIVIHPTDPQRMWVGGVAGGIWYSSNGGTTWQPVNDFMANLAVSTMVIDPSNPSSMYAGTGEGFYNADGIRGAGVFKSSDGGVTWTQLAETATTNWLYVNRLAISPDGSTILAATRSGVWRSVNGGTTWTVTNNASDTADIDFHPTNNSLAIAGGISGDTKYSTDGGITWNTATDIPANGRVELGYARSNPLIVYASINQNSGEIWQSTNGGQSYTLRSTGTNYLASQGWYDNALWVDPTNSNFLIVGGIDLWKSSNGGTSLTQISTWYNAPNSAHADNQIIVSSPQFNGTSNTTVFFGNDGGMYTTSNVYTVGNNLPDATNGWQELNNNLGITQFYGAAGNPTSGKIVGGTQDNGSLRYTGATETWNTVFGGDGGFSAADPTNPNYVYGEYVYANIHRSNNSGTTGSGEYISGNYYNGAGSAWKPVPYKITDAQNSCALFIAPFILDPNDPNRMLVGGCSLWRTNDVRTVNTPTTGPSWAAISNPNAGPAISAIAVAPGNSNIIWVGYENGLVYMTNNGTAAAPTWSQVDLNGVGLPNRYVTRLTIDRLDSAIVYATFGGFSAGNVWRTSNSGTSWSNISGNGQTALPSVPVRSLVINPTNANWLYIGTEVGVFTSEDGGSTWKLPQDGPSNVSVDELFWMNDTLVAATHGRGLFRTTLGSSLQNTGFHWRELSGNANGAIDPGETIGITVDLRNQGNQAATNVSGALAVTAGSATIQVGASTYANIPTRATQSNATEYTVLVDPNQPCGGKLSFSHTASYGGNKTLVSDHTLATGTTASVNYAYTGPNIPIIDNTVVDLPLTIDSTVPNASVVVHLNLNHTFDGDLIISLVSPNGTVIVLSNANGGDGDDYTDTIFDDQAATAITAGSPPFTGRFQPQNALAGLKSESKSGIWKLRVEDTAGNDIGNVLGWSLDLQTQNCSATTTISPPSLDFGTQSLGSTGAIQLVTLQNISGSAATISTIALTGDFRRSGGTCPSSFPGTLAAGTSCTIGVVFSPSANGSHTGSLSITSNAISSPQTIALSGTGQNVNIFLPLVIW